MMMCSAHLAQLGQLLLRQLLHALVLNALRSAHSTHNAAARSRNHSRLASSFIHTTCATPSAGERRATLLLPPGASARWLDSAPPRGSTLRCAQAGRLPLQACTAFASWLGEFAAAAAKTAACKGGQLRPAQGPRRAAGGAAGRQKLARRAARARPSPARPTAAAPWTR